MQIGTLFSAPMQTAIRLANTASFTRRRSPLNPDVSHGHDHDRDRDSDSLQTHLANLEKLLRANPELPPAEEKHHRRPTPLDRLNLGGIWPGSRKVEEMSPRHLNGLQRLLSNSRDQSPSPRRPLDPDRWRDYHGSRDWAGLLDPLDDDLRREIIRYGEFVQGAYHTFHSDPATPAAAAPPPQRNVSIPDRSYHVTCNLYATSAVGLPAWVDAVAPEFAWMTQRSSWAGFVAVCDDSPEIERMGRRRDIVVALRGTATCLEWAENARAHLVPISQAHETNNQAQPKVECGFLSLYKTPGAHVQSLSESIIEEVKRLMEEYEGEELSITITGHSLGAALAVLAADELSERIENAPPIAVISFGGPQVGNAAFAERVRQNGVKVLRVVNSRDVVTKVPGLAYSHVGCELRLDSMASPVLKPDADPACCHDLEAYLHLVDGFTGPDCPFRDSAKRPIWRLLNEQGANVKKLYTSKAQHLSTSLAAQPIVNGGSSNYICDP